MATTLYVGTTPTYTASPMDLSCGAFKTAFASQINIIACERDPMTVGAVVMASVGTSKGGNLRTAELVSTDAPMPSMASSVYVPFSGASNDWGGAPGSSVSPFDLTVAEAGPICGAILALWALAYGIRMAIRTLRDSSDSVSVTDGG